MSYVAHISCKQSKVSLSWEHLLHTPALACQGDRVQEPVAADAGAGVWHHGQAVVQHIMITWASSSSGMCQLHHLGFGGNGSGKVFWFGNAKFFQAWCTPLVKANGFQMILHCGHTADQTSLQTLYFLMLDE